MPSFYVLLSNRIYLQIALRKIFFFECGVYVWRMTRFTVFRHQHKRNLAKLATMKSLKSFVSCTPNVMRAWTEYTWKCKATVHQEGSLGAERSHPQFRSHTLACMVNPQAENHRGDFLYLVLIVVLCQQHGHELIRLKQLCKHHGQGVIRVQQQRKPSPWCDGNRLLI